jgi:membrane-associated phospholipid phosphatase
MSLGPEQARQSGGILVGGVSAVPSLHVGMVALTAYWLAVARRWTLCLTVPWVILVWTSTVVLGWHYIVDGAGGVLIAAASVWVTRQFVGWPWLNAQLNKVVK